jgi:hypothetical protein
MLLCETRHAQYGDLLRRSTAAYMVFSRESAAGRHDRRTSRPSGERIPRSGARVVPFRSGRTVQRLSSLNRFNERWNRRRVALATAQRWVGEAIEVWAYSSGRRRFRCHGGPPAIITPPPATPVCERTLARLCAQAARAVPGPTTSRRPMNHRPVQPQFAGRSDREQTSNRDIHARPVVISRWRTVVTIGKPSANRRGRPRRPANIRSRKVSRHRCSAPT